MTLFEEADKEPGTLVLRLHKCGETEWNKESRKIANLR
jgi:hypothetical protein